MKYNDSFMPANSKLKGFTIMELLVSMTLTGILVVFSFLGYNQIQKLFINYTVQSDFISSYNQLQKAMALIAERAKTIEKTSENTLSFHTDSSSVILDITEKDILLKFSSHTDTFHIAVKDLNYHYLQVSSELPSTLVESFDGSLFFQSQKFRLSFHKQYDAASVLKSTLEVLPPDELY